MESMSEQNWNTEATAFNDRGTFKWWSLDKPHLKSLLNSIIIKWRGSNARVSGKLGRWAAYSYREWCAIAGLSEHQLERYFRALVDGGLIERERHRFAGSKVHAFIRPTPLALQFMGKPDDLKALGIEASAGTSAEINAGSSAGTSAGTDYTPFPISKTYKNYPFHVSKSPEGLEKGKAGEIYKISPQASAPAAGLSDDPDVIEFKAKKLAKDLVKFPEIPGPHQAKLVHPAHKAPDQWPSLSHDRKAKFYAKYLDYVGNWYTTRKMALPAELGAMSAAIPATNEDGFAGMKKFGE